MTLLARIDGIPARVAVGFTAGNQVNRTQWTVTGGDAHAWPELYFPGIGWVPFEPTPRADGQVHQPAYATAKAASIAGIPLLNKSEQRKTGPGHNRKPPVAPSPQPTHVRTVKTMPDTTPTGDPNPTIGYAILIVVVLLIAIPAAIRFTGRRRHSHPHGAAAAAHAAWDEVHDSILDLGIDWPQGRTPRQTVGHLVAYVPSLSRAAEPLHRIGLAEQQARYATTVDPKLVGRLGNDVRSVRSALFARAGRWERIRATLFPRSSLRALQARMGGAADWRPPPGAASARLSGRRPGVAASAPRAGR